MPYMTTEGLLAGFDEYNGEHFVDSVHFSDKGSRAMARRVVRALSGSERLEKLVGARKILDIEPKNCSKFTFRLPNQG